MAAQIYIGCKPLSNLVISKRARPTGVTISHTQSELEMAPYLQTLQQVHYAWSGDDQTAFQGRHSNNKGAPLKFRKQFEFNAKAIAPFTVSLHQLGRPFISPTSFTELVAPVAHRLHGTAHMGTADDIYKAIAKDVELLRAEFGHRMFVRNWNPDKLDKWWRELVQLSMFLLFLEVK